MPTIDFSNVKKVYIPVGGVDKEVKEIKLGNTTLWKSSTPYVLFESDTQFTLAIGSGSSGGTIQYSTNGASWTNWSSGSMTSSGGGKLYLRQSGGSTWGKTFGFTGATNIKVSGDMRALIDYNTFESITSCPTTCFREAFKNNTNLVDVSGLNILFTSYGTQSLLHMFDGCTNLTGTPTMCDCVVGDESFAYMFYNCAKITKVPKNLRITGINKTASWYGCISIMFRGCTLLENVVPITVTSYDNQSSSDFQNVYSGCSSLKQVNKILITSFSNDRSFSYMYDSTPIKLYTSSSGTHTKAYRIPYTGTGSGVSTFRLMFNATYGDVTSPAINTTYYIDNDIEIV